MVPLVGYYFLAHLLQLPGCRGPNCGPATSIDSEGLLPEDFTLHGNYPNPFNANTRISFDLAEAASIMVQVYDVTGSAVTWTAQEQMGASRNRSVLLEAGHLSSGTYFYRVVARQQRSTATMTGIMAPIR